VTDHFLTSCATCGGHWLGHDSSSFGGVYRCPEHQAAHTAGFGPQPNDLVCTIVGPQTQCVVLAREADHVTLRRLGFPDAESFTVHISALHRATDWHVLGRTDEG